MATKKKKAHKATYAAASRKLRNVYNTARKLPAGFAHGDVNVSIDGGFTLTLKRG